MSQRLGMADGRCATILDSSRIFNDQLSRDFKVEAFDYRQKLQSMSPEEFMPMPTCSLFSYKDVIQTQSIRDDTNMLSK